MNYSILFLQLFHILLILLVSQLETLHQSYAWYRDINDPSGSILLVSTRTEVPVNPLPDHIYLQKTFFAYPPPAAGHAPLATATGKVLIFVFSWRSTNPKYLLPSTEVPINFLDVIRGYYTYPTTTQLVDLFSRLIQLLDRLSSSLYLCLSLDSIFILNPSVLGGSKHLVFRVCPYSVGLTRELPKSVIGSQIGRRTLAEFILLTITRLTSTQSTLLAHRLRQAFKDSPGLVAMFLEVMEISNLEYDLTAPNAAETQKFNDSLPEDIEVRLSVIQHDAKAHPHRVAALAVHNQEIRAAAADPQFKMKKIGEASPSAEAFLKLRDKDSKVVRSFNFRGDHVPALLTGMACLSSHHIHTLAADGLWRLVSSAETSKQELGLAIGVATECAAVLVPGDPSSSTGLVDPSSASKSEPWVWRMLLIDKVLYENERSADYARLRRTQQALLDHGISSQLGGSLINSNAHFTLKVLIPIVRVTTLMSFHFPVLASRLIFARNVRRMSKMCFDSNAKNVHEGQDSHRTKKILHDGDLQRYVGLMLIMSDFGSWIGQETSQMTDAKIEQQRSEEARLMNLWKTLDEDIFMLSVLPAWSPLLSDATNALIADKFHDILKNAINNYLTQRSKALETTHSMDSGQSSTNNSPSSTKELHQAFRKLSYTLDWIMQLAWNAPDLASVASFKSLYLSSFMSLITCKHNTPILTENLEWKDRPAFMDVPRQATISQLTIPRLPPFFQSVEAPYNPAIPTSASFASDGAASLNRDLSAATSFGLTQKPVDNFAEDSMSSFLLTSGLSSCETDLDPSSSSSSCSANTTSSSSSFLSEFDIEHDYTAAARVSELSSSFEHSSMSIDLPPQQSNAASNSRRYEISKEPIEWQFDSQGYIEQAVTQAQAKNPLNPENLEFIMGLHKFPLQPNDLSGFAKFCLDVTASRYYVPTPRGAPASEESIKFDVPPYRPDFSYLPNSLHQTVLEPPEGSLPLEISSEKYNSLRTLSSESAKKHPNFKFTPITLASLTHPICDSKGSIPEEIGTTGMVEFTFHDTGDKNRVFIGLTWDAQADCATPKPADAPDRLSDDLPPLPPYGIDYLVPGFSPTSMGLDLSTGCVYFMDMTGRKVNYSPLIEAAFYGTNQHPAPFNNEPTEQERQEIFYGQFLKKMPYAPPVSSGSKIAMCVAFDRVYFIIDSVFYPPIPNLVIPRGRKIHPLIRFTSLGTRVSQRCLTKRWTLERNNDGTLSDSQYNPLGHLLYLAELRSKVCPHYHAQRKAPGTRPTVNHILQSNEFNLLPESIQERLKLIHLAFEPCAADDCKAAHILKSLITRIINESKPK